MLNEDIANQERFLTAQHNRYKPRIDYMIEKYGEEFTMDDYGIVTSAKHPSWSLDVRYIEREECYMDDYIILLRRNEMQKIMAEILLGVYEQCKVFVYSEQCAPKGSSRNTTADDLLRSGAQGNASCIGVYCYTFKSPQSRGRDLERAVQTIAERGYGLHLQVVYVNKEIFNQITSQNVASYSADPKRFFCRASLTIPSRPDPDRMWQAGSLREQFQK